MEQSEPQYPWRFRPGVSGNPQGSLSDKARQERIEAKARELAVEYGGYDSLSPIDRALLGQAATLLVRKPRTYNDSVRVANSISRLLSGLRNRQKTRLTTFGPLREAG
jgi:hypothetical protein